MDVSGSDPVGQAYTVQVTRLARSAAKAQGEAAVALIEQAGGARQAPPVGANGEGSHINTYA